MLRTTTHGPITRIHLTRTILGRPIYSVSAYLIDGLLIDCGPPRVAPELIAWCRKHRIQQMVTTHHHEDHSGGAGPLRRALGLPVLAPAAAVQVLASFPRLEPYRWIVWGQPQAVLAQPLAETVETAHHRFRVIPTPGHCPDHICLYEPQQGWLFAGDLFIHEQARYMRADEDLATLVRSLRQVLALGPDLLICSHAGLIDDACGAIERKIIYWETRGMQARILQRSGLSVRAITKRLLGDEGFLTLFSAGHISKINLIRSLLSHPSPQEGKDPGDR